MTTDSELDSSEGPGDETVEWEHLTPTELETLTRRVEWEDEAFRDASEATFGGR